MAPRVVVAGVFRGKKLFVSFFFRVGTMESGPPYSRVRDKVHLWFTRFPLRFVRQPTLSLLEQFWPVRNSRVAREGREDC